MSHIYNFRARWYDPISGRWLSKDPIGISGGLNQYVAFGNNPVMFRDPSGLCTEGGYPYTYSSPNNTVSSVGGNLPYSPPPRRPSLPYDTPVLRAAPPRRPRRSDTVLIDPNNTIAARQFRASQYAPGADTSSIVGLLAAEQHGRAIGMAGGSFMGAATITTTAPQLIRAGAGFYLAHPNEINQAAKGALEWYFQAPPTVPSGTPEAIGVGVGFIADSLFPQ